MAVALCASATATEILNVSTALTLGDSSQLGRLSRGGIPQDWANTETFPGVLNPTTTFRYRVFVIDPITVGLGPFIQISVDDPLAGLFASAYFNAYLPDSGPSPNLGFNTNWLGDAGVSGNSFGNPNFFQVKVPTGASLVVVISTVASGGGIGESFNLLVESFSDTEFTDARPRVVATPDVANSALLLGVALAGLIWGQRVTSRRIAP